MSSKFLSALIFLVALAGFNLYASDENRFVPLNPLPECLPLSKKIALKNGFE